MKLRIATARQGTAWVQAGIKTFFAQPLALTSLFFFSMMLMSLIGSIPMVGTAVALGLLPLSTLAMMVAAAVTLQGKRPTLGTVIGALRMDAQRRNAFVLLGCLYALGFVVVLGISSIADGGQFARLNLMGGEISREVVEQPEFQLAMLLTLALYVPLSMLFWHAPGLIYWHRVPAVKAVFFSLVACLRNMAAFTMFGLVWMGVSLGFGMVLALLATALGALLGTWVAVGLMVLGSLMLAAMFMASIVFSFRDCFEPPDGSPALED